MSIPSLIIRQLLVANALSDSDWPCTVSHMPDSPDNAICVYGRGSDKDGRYMSGAVVEHPALMIMVRSKTYRAGWNKMNSIQAFLDTVRRTLVTFEEVSYRVDCVKRNAGFNELGIDDSKTRRDEFSLNITITFKSLTELVISDFNSTDFNTTDFT